MTTVAAVTTKEGSWIASDSRFVVGRDIILIEARDAFSQKWAGGKGLWVATVGDCRAIIPVRNALRKWSGKRAAGYVERLKECLSADGYQTAEGKTGPVNYGVAGMLVFKGKVYQFDAGLSIGRVGRVKGFTFWAEGSGADAAKGSLYSLLPLGTPPPDALKVALRAAATYDAGSGPPFRVKRVG